MTDCRKELLFQSQSSWTVLFQSRSCCEAVQKCVSTVGLKVCGEVWSSVHTESQIMKFLTWENLKWILCGVAGKLQDCVWYFAVILVCPLVVESQHVADLGFSSGLSAFSSHTYFLCSPM